MTTLYYVQVTWKYGSERVIYDNFQQAFEYAMERTFHKGKLEYMTREGKLTTTPDATCSTHLLYHGQESGQVIGAAVHPMELGEVYLKKANI